MKPIHLIEFPETRQATNFSCGAACVQAILLYYGISVREDQLINEMHVRSTNIEHSGVKPKGIVKYLRDFGLSADLITGMTVEQLADYVVQDIPVIVAIQAWKNTEPGLDYYRTHYDDGHYIVAIGYNADIMIFDDPSVLSNHAYLSIKDFLARWHDKDSAGVKYQQLGIPVYGQPPKFKLKRLIPIL